MQPVQVDWSGIILISDVADFDKHIGKALIGNFSNSAWATWFFGSISSLVAIPPGLVSNNEWCEI